MLSGPAKTGVNMHENAKIFCHDSPSDFEDDYLETARNKIEKVKQVVFEISDSKE